MPKLYHFALFAAAMFSFCLAFSTGAATGTKLSASSSSINFGAVNVGSRVQQQIKITNPASFSVSITTVAVSGRYFVTSGLSAPHVRLPKASATFAAEFTPLGTGLQSGKIVIAGKGLSAELVITLTANGVSDQISIVPPSASFGNVPLGSFHSQTFTVTNHRSVPITISHGHFSGAGFSYSEFADVLTINPGKSATLNLAFTPAKPGAFSSSALFYCSAPGLPFTTVTIPVSGNGIASTNVLGVSPSALSFGNVNVGSIDSLGLTLSNPGNSNISISQVKVTGAGFSVNGSVVGVTLEPGQSTPLAVVFGPKSAGSVSGTISVIAGSASASVALSGSGEAAASLSVSLSWSASSSPNVIGYVVERGIVSGGPYQPLNSSPVAGTGYVDPTVKDKQTYFYVVRSVASDGEESPPSEQVGVTTPSC